MERGWAEADDFAVGGPSAVLGAMLPCVVFWVLRDSAAADREQMTVKKVGPEWSLRVRGRRHDGCGRVGRLRQPHSATACWHESGRTGQSPFHLFLRVQLGLSTDVECTPAGEIVCASLTTKFSPCEVAYEVAGGF